jgi:hypothetical protein
MVPNRLPLTVEGVVFGTVEAGVLSAGKSALDGLAHRWRAQRSCEALRDEH